MVKGMKKKGEPMSFIIQGINLPEKNKGLYFHIFNGKVEVVHPLDACEVEYTDAQAIQIPKGHGNLKDSKEILARAEQEVDGLVMSAEHLPMVIEWILDKSDTFLEAEEADELNTKRD